MAVSRLRRVGILLFVLLLTADLAAAGFCNGELLYPSATALTVSAAVHSASTSSCGHQCFCGSTGTKAVTFMLPVEEQEAIVTPSPTPRAPDTSVAHTSPPPRL